MQQVTIIKGTLLSKKFDSKIELAEEKGKKYILKSFDKEKLLQNEARLQSALNERDILKRIDHPLLNRLIETRKDESTLYLVLKLANGLDLY